MTEYKYTFSTGERFIVKTGRKLTRKEIAQYRKLLGWNCTYLREELDNDIARPISGKCAMCGR